jgi:hypothetical protein
MNINFENREDGVEFLRLLLDQDDEYLSDDALGAVYDFVTDLQEDCNAINPASCATLHSMNFREYDNFRAMVRGEYGYYPGAVQTCVDELNFFRGYSGPHKVYIAYTN